MNTQKRSVLVIVSVLVLIVLIFLIAHTVSNKNQEAATPEQSSSQNGDSSSSTTPVKMQTGTKGNITIAYPITWGITKPSSTNFQIYNELGEDKALATGTTQAFAYAGACQFHVTPVNTYGTSVHTLADVYKARGLPGEIANIQNESIGGKAAIPTISKNGTMMMSKDFVYEETEYSIVCSSGSTGQYAKDMPIFKSILASLTFIK